MSGWLVIGGGYTGGRVVELLRARGDEVKVTRRAQLELGGASVDEIAGWTSAGGVIVVTAPPVDAAGGAEAKIAAAAARVGARRIVYVSSTGVYAPAAGAWVDETFAVVPTTARAAAERAIAGGAVPCVWLRAAGIWGPGRGAVERIRAGTYRIVGTGDTYVSRVHVDDLAAAVVGAGDARACGSVYNVADDEPCTANEMVRALGVEVPRVAVADVAPEIAAMFTADRRIDNRRLKAELGWAPRWPSWRSGLDVVESDG